MPRIHMTITILAAAILIGGCQQGAALSERPNTSLDSVQVGKDEGNSSSTQKEPTPNPSEPGQQAGQSGQGKGSSGGGQATTADGKHRFVPERVFQLDKLQVATCKVDKHTFHLWVMDTDPKREEGMMWLVNSDFKDDDGMIFVFMSEDSRRFWMRNTLVDLDVDYCDKTGKILNDYTMKAHDETTDYSSKGSAMYVIELKAGILKKLGIKPGMKWEIPESVVSKDDGNN